MYLTFELPGPPDHLVMPQTAPLVFTGVSLLKLTVDYAAEKSQATSITAGAAEPTEPVHAGVAPLSGDSNGVV